MSEHPIRIVWAPDGAPFTYDTYTRTHRVEFGTGSSMNVSAAAPYRGDPRVANPEELLAAAAASCHMMSFLAVAAKQRYVVVGYSDDAIAHLELDAGRKMAVTRIDLRPAIRFEGRAPTAEQLAAMHETAHRNCFIARALSAQVTVTPIDPSDRDLSPA